MRRRSMMALMALVALAVLAGSARAQDVGSVADLQGGLDIGRDTTWTPAAIGVPIQLHDELRTAKGGRAVVVFRDGSVLVQVFDPAQSLYQSTLKLLRGKVRALVSDYYKQPRSQFRIETHTAVSGVRGTEFVVTFDPIADVSDVVGVEGQVEVHSVLDPINRGVFVTRMELTRVARGKLPTPVRRLDEPVFRQYLEGLEFIGDGRPESMVHNNGVLLGTDVPVPFRPGEFARFSLRGPIAGPPPVYPKLPPYSPPVLGGPGDVNVRF